MALAPCYCQLMSPDDLPTHVSPSYGVAQPWERQMRESDQDWAWFRAYRDSAYPEGYSGPWRARELRTLALTWDCSYATAQSRFNTFCWAERVGALDRHLEALRAETNWTHVQRVAAAHIRVLDKTRQLVDQCVDDLLARHMAGERLKPREVFMLMEWQFKNDRLATGQSTENVAVAHGFDLDVYSVEELEALKALAEKGYNPPQKTLAPDLEGRSE